MRRLTENFDKEMDRLEPDQLVVVRIDAERKEESRVSSVDQFVITKL